MPETEARVPFVADADHDRRARIARLCPDAVFQIALGWRELLGLALAAILAFFFSRGGKRTKARDAALKTDFQPWA